MSISPSRTTDRLPSPVAASSCVGSPCPALAAASKSIRAADATHSARSSRSVAASTLPFSSKRTADSIWDEISLSSSSAAFGSVMAERLASREMREVFSKFFADRGTHLAAMIAYFALLSFVPLLFLALALLGFGGRADESSFYVTELKKIFPSLSVDSIISSTQGIQRHATSLGIVGGAFLTWSSLSLFSVLESTFNIVYNRPYGAFLHGKYRAFVVMLASLVVLFVGLLTGGI